MTRNLSCLSIRRQVAPSSTAQRPTMAGVNVTCQRSQREAGGAGARTPDLRITWIWGFALAESDALTTALPGPQLYNVYFLDTFINEI